MFKLVSLVLLCVALLVPSFAQNRRSSPNERMALPPDEVPWEYLLVNVTQNSTALDLGVGQVIKSLELTKAKIVHDKSFATSSDNTYFNRLSESVNAQAALDSAGKAGWELIAVVNGSDQAYAQFVFKRKFNAERSRREAEQRKLEQNRAAGKTAEQAVVEKVEFVDLDRIESISAQKAAEAKAVARLEQALRNLKDIPITDVKVSAYFQQNVEPLTQAEVIVDGNQALLKGNQYRASQAQTYLQQAATEIFNKVGLRQSAAYNKIFELVPWFDPNNNAPRVQIKISVNLNSKKQSQTVAVGIIKGNWTDVATNK